MNLKNKKSIILIIFLLSGCASHKMTVIRNDLTVDTHCPNLTKVITLLKKTDGTMIKKCGFWGLVGDQIKVKEGLLYKNQDQFLPEEEIEKTDNIGNVVNNNNTGDVDDSFIKELSNKAKEVTNIKD